MALISMQRTKRASLLFTFVATPVITVSIFDYIYIIFRIQDSTYFILQMHKICSSRNVHLVHQNWYRISFTF
jgi:hypothetical protein